MPNSTHSKRPTQRTIAAKVGISVGAVSRALANDPQMAEETRALVHKTAQELGYSPDRAAQRLRTGRTQVIYLILPPHEEILGFGTLLIGGISARLEGTPYHLVVLPDFGHDESAERIRRVVRDKLADGIIFSRTTPDDARIKFLLEADFPFVSHGRSELATPHPYVDFDNFTFARQAADMLIKRGARRIGILLPPERFTFRQHLLHGFMKAVRASGIDHEILEGVSLDSDADTISAQIHQRFGEKNAPDGLILPGDVSGLAALAAIQDRGLVAGQDVQVVVKQTSGVFDLVRPRVASLYEDLSAAGETLADLLLKRIEGTPATDLQYIQPISGFLRDA
ncbi:LacI family DNA-binding transcriptional regulator [Sulfitobacter sp. M57]|uniref:LacI family transcriptional regulator n=1 Tax=unclassified Sulfitobacter TaxID=196795 RepID=UPI0023E2CB26|nr:MULTISPECIES: LacI family transcriptional regulator [unclassified Sulfitobacter]MDF3412828.1 LacI family DNA-binding transcriptional regulator [Sulfitobacter sp. KE5]MDF3421887.1 LacI family DNA-binding transcriptional regulator [Sulfitobacter sp. KE43]MDF3431377.1 LacI family DNA-binding transcriptional regulator [Sulfitobacter sp. KE42]MDF3457018.1 LacI family DNA-binding transcriptional regulator [Sulfitobacter sp. S74]MDF3460921.1 LacI family DNA-binding transcriptional regulator [Sulfi